jgi:hypothetical protein
MERCIEKIIAIQDEWVALEMEIEALEATKRRYWAWYAPLSAESMGRKRDWQHLTVEASNPSEWAALLKKASQVFSDFRFEMYASMDLA